MPRPKSDPHLPNGTGYKILRAIGRYHMLTANQTVRVLGFSPKSITHIYEQLKRLSTQGYLKAGQSQTKGVPAVWLLSQKGRSILASEGIATEERVHHLPPFSLHLAHRIAVTDVLIGLNEFADTNPGFHILDMQHEAQLSRRPIKLKLSDGKDFAYAPDAWIHLQGPNGKKAAFLLELDRGTEEQRIWRRKVDAILSLAAGNPSLYEKTFGVPYFRVIVLATPGYQDINVRASTLLHWTELELTKLGKKQWARYFNVAPANPSEELPSDVLIQPRFVIPGDTTAQRLLEDLL